MRLLYRFLAYIAVPIVFAGVVLRAARDPSCRGGFGERFGLGARLRARCIWVHAVSMGEVAAAAPLVRAWQAKAPDDVIVLTSATPAGVQRARQLFGASVDVRFAPYDLPGAARRFIDRVRPRIAVLMETEIWPHWHRELALRSIPRVIVNARISDHSWPRYRRLRPLLSAALADTVVLAQSARDAERFLALGSSPGNTSIAGNLKFDVPAGGGAAKSRGAQLRANELNARSIWVAGSTHAGEEEVIVSAHRLVRAHLASCVLVLAPRHAARFEEVAHWLVTHQVPFVRRSSATALDPTVEVLLLDTLGELVEFYAAANAAFVGGSLVPVGGHNLLEPCALGVPVATGPYNDNAPDIYRLLSEHGAVQSVHNAAELASIMHRWLSDTQVARRAGARALEVIEANRGALKKTLVHIETLVAKSTRSA